MPSRGPEEGSDVMVPLKTLCERPFKISFMKCNYLLSGSCVQTPGGSPLVLEGDPDSQNRPSRNSVTGAFSTSPASLSGSSSCHRPPRPRLPHLPREDCPDPNSPSPHPSHQTTLQLLAHVTGVPEGWHRLSHPCVPSTSTQPASPAWPVICRRDALGEGPSQAGVFSILQRLPHAGLRCSWEMGRHGPTPRTPCTGLAHRQPWEAWE